MIRHLRISVMGFFSKKGANPFKNHYRKIVLWSGPLLLKNILPEKKVALDGTI